MGQPSSPLPLLVCYLCAVAFFRDGVEQLLGFDFAFYNGFTALQVYLGVGDAWNALKRVGDAQLAVIAGHSGDVQFRFHTQMLDPGGEGVKEG